MTKYAIEAHNIVKKFGDFTALNDISLEVPTGKIYGFLGPNGCGKSTMIRVLTGLMNANEGSVTVLDLNIPKQADLLRLKIGYMTQKFSLYDDLSTRENLQFIGEIFGLSGTQLSDRINEQLQCYQLDQLSNQRVGSMSGGQKQRLSLAAATMHNPSLLFLDEPTSAVDPQSRREFWETLFDLCDQGTTILVTTHYMDEAERCHTLGIMEAGKMRAIGTPETLMSQLGAYVIEITTQHSRALKERLLAKPEVKSAAQVGLSLRVLIDKSISEPISWLTNNFSELSSGDLKETRANLEDVFVTVTGEGRQ